MFVYVLFLEINGVIDGQASGCFLFGACEISSGLAAGLEAAHEQIMVELVTSIILPE